MSSIDTAQALPPEGVVIVEDAGSGDFAEIVRSGRHVLPADEPVAVAERTPGRGLLNTCWPHSARARR